MAASIEAVIEFKCPLFQVEQNTKQWQAFQYLANGLENGDFNRGRNSFLTKCLKFLLEWRRKLKSHRPT